MASYRNVVVKLKAKKQEISKIRRRSAKQLHDTKSVYRRSRSGLASADRRIESAKEQLSGVSLVLNQKLSQKESILRLVGAANQRLESEREAKEQAEQDIEFADGDEEKRSAQVRLRGLLERISDIEFEIKNRKKMAKKLEDEISEYSSSKDKISTKIKKTNQAKPELKRLMKSSEKDTEKLAKKLERSTKQEQSAKNTLKKAEEKFQSLLSKKRKQAAKKRSAGKPAKRPAKPARAAKKTARKAARSAKSKRR